MCFNPRPRAGGDSIACTTMLESVVSIHAPARGATRLIAKALTMLDIVSIHAPARGATAASAARAGIGNVSIHAPARGATPSRAAAHQRHVVSIHAPARGATLMRRRPITIFDVSIHAPARGATVLSKCTKNKQQIRTISRTGCIAFRFIPYQLSKSQNNDNNFNVLEQSRNPPENHVSLGFAASCYQRSFLIDARFRAHVLDTSPPVRPKIVETQAVLLRDRSRR